MFSYSPMAAVILATALFAAPGQGQTTNIETLRRLRLVEELRIGSATDPVAGFSRIGPVDVDRDGNLYAFEMQDLQIRVFDPKGQRIRTIGRGGQGPGEFESVAPFGLKGDTLWAIASTTACKRRIMLFTRSGTFLSSAEASGPRVSLQTQNVGVSAPQFMRADGNFVGGEVTCYTGGAADNPRQYSPTDTVRVPRILFSAKGTILDTLGWYSLPPTVRVPRDTVTIDGRKHPVPVPPSAVPVKLILADGRIDVVRDPPRGAGQSTLRVVRTRLNGDTVYARTVSYTPVRFTDAVLDSIAEQSARTPGGSYRLVDGVPQITPFRDVPAAVALIRSKMQFPAFQLPVSSAYLGADNSVWLRREDDGGPMTHWVLLDPQGNARGRLDVPRRFRIAWVNGNVMWAVVADDDDVPFLVRYRIAD